VTVATPPPDFNGLVNLRDISGDFLILLPPSEGKALGGINSTWSPDQGVFGNVFNSARLEIAAALRASHGGTSTMLGVKGHHLERAQAANLNLLNAATLPAWQRYTGVVWDHLDPVSLTERQRSRILVASGLGGLFAAEDPVPDYRLKMGASVPGIGSVARFWREHVAALLQAVDQKTVIVDLLAQEQRKALPEGLPVLEVTLRTKTGALGGHAAKAAKGLLARHLVSLAGRVSAARLRCALNAWEHPDFSAEIHHGEPASGTD
jgi:cytoplasmic iron level regulating protein YaaA (DUF328/UPF0246 family)